MVWCEPHDYPFFKESIPPSSLYSIPPFLQNHPGGKVYSAGKDFNQFPPLRAATTFAFSSVIILPLWTVFSESAEFKSPSRALDLKIGSTLDFIASESFQTGEHLCNAEADNHLLLGPRYHIAGLLWGGVDLLAITAHLLAIMDFLSFMDILEHIWISHLHFVRNERIWLLKVPTHLWRNFYMLYHNTLISWIFLSSRTVFGCWFKQLLLSQLSVLTIELRHLLRIILLLSNQFCSKSEGFHYKQNIKNWDTWWEGNNLRIWPIDSYRTY